MKPRTIRQLWKDPMCNCDDWQVIIAGTPEAVPMGAVPPPGGSGPGRDAHPAPGRRPAVDSAVRPHAHAAVPGRRRRTRPARRRRVVLASLFGPHDGQEGRADRRRAHEGPPQGGLASGAAATTPTSGASSRATPTTRPRRPGLRSEHPARPALTPRPRAGTGRARRRGPPARPRQRRHGPGGPDGGRALVLARLLRARGLRRRAGLAAGALALPRAPALQADAPAHERRDRAGDRPARRRRGRLHDQGVHRLLLPHARHAVRRGARPARRRRPRRPRSTRRTSRSSAA